MALNVFRVKYSNVKHFKMKHSSVLKKFEWYLIVSTIVIYFGIRLSNILFKQLLNFSGNYVGMTLLDYRREKMTLYTVIDKDFVRFYSSKSADQSCNLLDICASHRNQSLIIHHQSERMIFYQTSCTR